MNCVEDDTGVHPAPERHAWLTILSLSEERRDVLIDSLCGRNLRVLAGFSVKLVEPVRLEVDDEMMLGEISRCRLEQGRYEIGVRVDQCLRDLSSLSALMQQLLLADESSRSREIIPRTGRLMPDA